MQLNAEQSQRGREPSEEKFFLGRQPILDREQKILAYELLFRSADISYAIISDHFQVCASVMINTLVDFGLEQVLGRHKGFFNVTRDMLMSEALELLPREQVVIELLETIVVDAEVVARCRELKEKGFTLALDDHLYSPEFEELYRIVSIVKVDLMALPLEQLPAMVKILKQWPLTLLAEKVETQEQYDFCAGLGFELFQGFFFARPVVLKQKKVDISKVALIGLMNKLMADAEIKEIEDSFKQNPNLIYSLLRLVNSVFFGLREKVRSLRHAIMVLGQAQLRRWVMLALYACTDSQTAANPLLEMAAVRGRLMEQIVIKFAAFSGDRELAERAFMTGILSLMDVLFEAPMPEVVKQLNITEDIRRALVDREGPLGILLQLAEKVEQTEFEAVGPLLDRSRITLDQLLEAQLETINWANGLDLMV